MRPFLSIWTKPLETFKYLNIRGLNGKGININYLFALISLSLPFKNLTDAYMHIDPFKTIGFIFSIILLALLSVVSLKYILSYFFWQFGKILNGKATLAEIQLVLAYSAIPNIIHLVIALIFIIPAIQTGNINTILHQHPITFIVIWLFTIRNLIIGLSYFNKYSYGYAVLNIVILGAIFEAISLMIKH